MVMLWYLRQFSINPTLGVERNSPPIRLTINLDFSKTNTIFNYNSNNKTCYAVWNKDMGVLQKETDWMLTMTMLDMIPPMVLKILQ